MQYQDPYSLLYGAFTEVVSSGEESCDMTSEGVVVPTIDHEFGVAIGTGSAMETLDQGHCGNTDTDFLQFLNNFDQTV